MKKIVTFSELLCLTGRDKWIPPSRRSNLPADAETRLSGTGAHRVAKTIIELECADVWRQISNYLDDEVDAGLRATMAAHFKDCAHCSAVLDGTRNVIKLVGDERAFEISFGASERFYRKLKDHLAAREQKHDWRAPDLSSEPQWHMPSNGPDGPKGCWERNQKALSIKREQSVGGSTK